MDFRSRVCSVGRVPNKGDPEAENFKEEICDFVSWEYYARRASKVPSRQIHYMSSVEKKMHAMGCNLHGVRQTSRQTLNIVWEWDRTQIVDKRANSQKRFSFILWLCDV